MNETTSPALAGRVASLHLHPAEGGAPLHTVDEIDLVEGKGIAGDLRYFGRLNREGKPTRRQVSLMAREQVQEHASALGLEIGPGRVRANIETTGIDLIALLNRKVEIGSAVLWVYAPRDPCEKMDAICLGLRERMMDRRQGILAEVLVSGKARVGDAIRSI